MPKEMRHFASCIGETIVQLHGMGPFVSNYVNPADDPDKKKPWSFDEDMPPYRLLKPSGHLETITLIDPVNECNGDFATTIRYHESLCKIDHFPSADCRIIDNHEGREAY
jgi:hypothetical protein